MAMGVVVRQKIPGKGNPWWVFIAHKGRRTSKLVGDRKATDKVASDIRAQLQLDQFEFEEKRRAPVLLFKDFAEGYMQTYAVMNLKDSTRDSYQSILDQHLIPCFGHKQLDEISKKDVKDFLSEKRQGKLALNSLRNIKRCFSSIMSEAVDDEIIPDNPVLKAGKILKKKKEEVEEIRALTWEEKNLLEDTIQKHYPKHYPLFLTALRTGMRIGELIGLQPGDLDFNGRFIEVRRNFAKGRLTTPKSGKGRRVDMSPQLAEVLQKYLVDRKKEALRLGWGEPPEWLFYSETGGPLDVHNLRKRVFYKALEKAKLRQIRIHDLRHTYATLRISKGDNILDVSKQLGHYSPKLTLDVYAGWIPGLKKAEVDELDRKTAPTCTPAAPEYHESPKPELEENREKPLVVGVGDARLERATFGSGDQRSIHLS
jgi:integrase